MKTILKASMIAAVFALFTLSAGATTLVGSLPSSARIQIPADNSFGPGPQSGPNYTWTSTGAGSVFGYTGSYGFGGNGSWDGALGAMAGVNDSSDTMTFAFTTPVYEAGDYFNYAPGSGTPTTIAVYSTSDVLLESYTLSFLTSGGTDQGEWLGFSETTPIGYFTATGNYIGLTATPEPGTLLLLGSGLVGLAGVLRRKLAR